MENIENFVELSGIEKESIVDGPGIRFVLFAQGCPHRCVGCHNPETHSLNGGKKFFFDDVVDMIKQNPIISGVTFSGGEPFAQASRFAVLAKKIHKLKYNIITYTGYTFEEILNNENEDLMNLLRNSDLLIDGPFDINRKSITSTFKGSTNQRIINVKYSLKYEKIIEQNLLISNFEY
ncbi:MAG: anaerobic ribonucleoside-triphosphate reductase activating protein [Candidatus Paraimprobicoccus trichonymphae]|uniref:Anaerobic ribonucleoside-triphosphate reductase-activating protein n=1 Tax=Candidatus Paraimprobicoccus trichonymphae TaxID=3033793 RepID=A0AA48I564_9FIRM|nr:MAG: anaerobic ribonucleoside-triphosphate reductase activating protein [Candidatus Paraimprobicoccus trichonymphae]